MKFDKYALPIAAIPFIVSVFAGSYMVRWLSVLLLGAVFAFFLFFDVRMFSYRRSAGGRERRKTDFERTVRLVEKAKNGSVARSLIEEKIIEIYALLSEDYNETYRSLSSSPNEALRVLRSGGDFLDGLDRALKIVEADVDENRRG